MTKLESFLTNDGSSSLYHPELDETYHSRHGAIAEAKHVFIEMGLAFFLENNPSNEIAVFEMGFGTGLNALLTALWSEQHQQKVLYESIEKVVLDEKTTAVCNYPELVNSELASNIFTQLHQSKWGEKAGISAFFELCKIEGDIESFSKTNYFDIVFYDAFGPRVQPHLWEVPVLSIIYNSLKINGIFVTYCAKGSVRRNLIELGFKVERLPGPPGKREMLRALKV